jgi:hypothetical protein
MATTVTKNIYVAPEDGWVEVVAPASTIQYLYAMQFPYNHGVYLYVGTSIPTELYEPTGIKMDSDDAFVMNVPTGSVGCWVRCLTPAWGGGKHTDNAKSRLDVVVTTA